MDSVRQAVAALGDIDRPDTHALSIIATGHNRVRYAQRGTTAVILLTLVTLGAAFLGRAGFSESRSVEAASATTSPLAPPSLDDGLVVHHTPGNYVLVLDQRMNDPALGSFTRRQTFSAEGLPLNAPNAEILIVYVEQRKDPVERESESTSIADVPGGVVEIRGEGSTVEFRLSDTMTVGAVSDDLSTQELITTLESIEVGLPDCLRSPSTGGCRATDSAFVPSDGAVDEELGPVTVTTRPGPGA